MITTIIFQAKKSAAINYRRAFFIYVLIRVLRRPLHPLLQPASDQPY